MQDKILLGFLMDGGKTGYQVKKLMETGTNFFFSTSFGSIYPAFKKLEKEQKVTVEEKIEGGKLKKIYSITELGKKTFQEWLQKKPLISRLKDETALKIYFFSELSLEERKKQIDSYILVLLDQIKELNNLKKFLQTKEIDEFQMYNLDLGIDYYSFALQKMNEFKLKFLDK